jgi:septum formation protein
LIPRLSKTLQGPEIVLASTSSIRQTLLTKSGLKFGVQAPNLDENQLKRENPSLPPHELAVLLAQRKALSLMKPNHLVIGADQTLSCEGQLYNKAHDKATMSAQLAQLRGKTHSLHSAVAVASDGHIKWSCCIETHLTMRNFSDAFLNSYIDKNASSIIHCLGGYQLEAEGINLFEKIEGDYFAILGLPLLPLLAYLRQENYLSS